MHIIVLSAVCILAALIAAAVVLAYLITVRFMKKYGGTLVENSEEGVYEGLKLLYENKVKPMDVDFEKYNKEAIKEFEDLLK